MLFLRNGSNSVDNVISVRVDISGGDYTEHGHRIRLLDKYIIIMIMAAFGFTF